MATATADAATEAATRKVAVDRDAFADAAIRVAKALPSNALLAAMHGTRIEVADGRARLTATDGEIAEVATVADVDADDDVVVLVPGRALADQVQTLPSGPATLTVDEGRKKLVLRAGNRRTSVRLLDSLADFPEPPSAEEDAAAITVRGSDLAAALDRVVVACGTDNARPALTGVHLRIAGGAAAVAATDSYRIAVDRLPADDSVAAEALLPRSAVDSITRTLRNVDEDATVTLGSAVVVDVPDRHRVSSRQIDARFPDYQAILDKSFGGEITVDRDELRGIAADAVRATGHPAPLRLTVGDGTARAHAASTLEEDREFSADLAEVSAPEGLDIAFNAKFLTQALDKLSSGTLRVRLTDPTGGHGPTKWETADADGDDRYTHVVMPVNLSDGR